VVRKKFFTDMEIPENWKPVRGASNYALSPDGYVYNLKFKRRLNRKWRDLNYHSWVRDDDGTQRSVNHSRLSVSKSSLPNVDMVTVWGYPDYKVTRYGAVWKYRNTGKRYRNNPFLVGTKDIGEKEYVRLKTKDGRAHWVRMEKIMEEAYPND